MGINNYIAEQFSHPEGFVGEVVSFIMNMQNRRLYKETMRLLPLSDTDSVLDIGCGNDYMLNMLARRYDCMFTGIDISASIVRSALKRNHKFVESGRMNIIWQDILATSFVDCSFSRAYTVNTVYFWENLSEVMTEIHRILKPNGYFINTLYSDKTLSRFPHTQFGYKRFPTDLLVREGLDAGFTATVSPILDEAAYCIRYQKKP